jgi:hypothetical protein
MPKKSLVVTVLIARETAERLMEALEHMPMPPLDQDDADQHDLYLALEEALR